MRTLVKTSALLTVAAVAGAVGLRLDHSTGGPGEAPGCAVDASAWTAADGSYRFTLESDGDMMALPPFGDGQPVAAGFSASGTLAAARSGAGLAVRFEVEQFQGHGPGGLEQSTFRTAMARALASGILLSRGDDGWAMAGEAVSSPVGAGFVREFLAHLTLDLPMAGCQGGWLSRVPDPHGVAVFRTGLSPHSDGGLMTRDYERYESFVTEGAEVVLSPGSRIVSLVTPGSRRIERSTGRRGLTITGRGFQVRSSLTLELARTGGQTVAPAEAAAPPVVTPTISANPQQDVIAARADARRRLVADADLGALFARLRHLNAASDPAPIAYAGELPTLHALAGLRPEAILDELAAYEPGGPESPGWRVLVCALVHGGTPSSLAAVARYARGRPSVRDRTFIAAAAGLAPVWSDDLRVWLQESATTPEAGDLRPTALLALGSLGRSDDAPAAARSAIETAILRLGTDSNGRLEPVAVAALGNLASERLYSLLANGAAALAPGDLRHLVIATGRLDRPTLAPLLLPLLAPTVPEPVRLAVAGQLALGAWPAPVWPAVARAARTDPAVAVRLALVQAMGRALGAHPQLAAVLEEMAEEDASGEVRVNARRQLTQNG